MMPPDPSSLRIPPVDVPPAHPVENSATLLNQQQLTDLKEARWLPQAEPSPIESELPYVADLDAETKQSVLQNGWGPRIIQGEPQTVSVYPLPGISEVVKRCDLEGIDSLPPADCLQPLPSQFYLAPDGEHRWQIVSLEGPDEAPLTLSARLEETAAQLRLEIMGPDHFPELLKALGHLEVAMLLLRNVGK